MSPDLHPDAVKLIRRMTDPPPSHERFVGERIDFNDVDPLVLGDVWSVAEAVLRKEQFSLNPSLAGATAEAIVALKGEGVPAFGGMACRDYLDLLSREAEGSVHNYPNDILQRQRRACFALTRCTDLAFDDLRTSAERFLATAAWAEMPHLALALGRLVGTAVETSVLDKLAADLAASPLLVEELRIAASLDLPGHLVLAEVVSWESHRPEPVIPAPRHRLSDVPRYVLFAETTLRQAVARVRAIHDRERPYASDKAFTPPEAKVVGRSLRVGLDRDEAWIPPVLDDLFCKVSVAPTTAKTMPSQAVAIALGQAIEDYPTPEAIVTLRKVLREIRHAGVDRKLRRSLRTAERGLAGRIEIALRLPPDQPMSKLQLTTLTRALEASFGADVALPYEDWRSRLAEHPHARGLAGALVWRLVDGAGDCMIVLPITESGLLRLEDMCGGRVDANPDCHLTLWHPSDASVEERDAWRDRIAVSQIRQPFKQVFREHYVLPTSETTLAETATFSGHAVSLRPFLGLARREGWRIEGRMAIARAVGRWTVTLDVNAEIAPGVTGWATTRGFAIWAATDPKWVPARFDELSAVSLSEVLRSVDLLVSTSGFGITPGPEPAPEDTHRHAHLDRLGESPLGPMAEMRKAAIERVLTGRPNMDGLRFDAKHLRLGPYAVHLATGRVTRHGDPLTIELPERSSIATVPWLPYDENFWRSSSTRRSKSPGCAGPGSDPPYSHSIVPGGFDVTS